MKINDFFSESLAFIRGINNKQNAGVPSMVTPLAVPPENIDLQVEFLERLGTSLQELSNTVSNGNIRPSSDHFSSRVLLANSAFNEFQGIKTLELNTEETTLLELSEEALMLSASSNSLLMKTINSSTVEADSISDRDICDKIRDLMNTVSDEYLGIFEHAVEKQTEFWRAFTDIQSKMASYTSASGSDIKLKVGDLCTALSALMIGSGGVVDVEYVIYPVQTTGEISIVTTEEEGKAWISALGLPESCLVLVYFPEMGYVITVDQSPIAKMYSDLKALTTGAEITMNSSKYQAWLTGFNAQAENIKTTCQTVTTKYSSANSLYDTLIKLLTSTITSLVESAKEFLKF